MKTYILITDFKTSIKGLTSTGNDQNLESTLNGMLNDLLGCVFCVFWRRGERARLPPVCSGFDSRSRRHKRAEFVSSLLCSERFFYEYSGFPLSKTNI